jgi:hypothetical protein
MSLFGGAYYSEFSRGLLVDGSLVRVLLLLLCGFEALANYLSTFCSAKRGAMHPVWVHLVKLIVLDGPKL